MKLDEHPVKFVSGEECWEVKTTFMRLSLREIYDSPHYQGPCQFCPERHLCSGALPRREDSEKPCRPSTVMISKARFTAWRLTR